MKKPKPAPAAPATPATPAPSADAPPPPAKRAARVTRPEAPPAAPPAPAAPRHVPKTAPEIIASMGLRRAEDGPEPDPKTRHKLGMRQERAGLALYVSPRQAAPHQRCAWWDGSWWRYPAG